ncbi:MAG: HNH endonuclease, partial [Pirellula sp.]
RETADKCAYCESKVTHVTFGDIEHIVPKSIGGKQTTLTCGRCNNDQGSDLDSQLVLFHKFENSICGASKESIRGTLHTADERLAIDIVDIAGNPQFVVVPMASNPRHVASSLAKAKELRIERMKVTFPVADLQSHSLALLKVGYLSAFKELGYSFLCIRRTEHRDGSAATMIRSRC